MLFHRFNSIQDFTFGREKLKVHSYFFTEPMGMNFNGRTSTEVNHMDIWFGYVIFFKKDLGNLYSRTNTSLSSEHIL